MAVELETGGELAVGRDDVPVASRATTNAVTEVGVSLISSFGICNAIVKKEFRKWMRWPLPAVL
jgi:hypothetical protein